MEWDNVRNVDNINIVVGNHQGGNRNFGRDPRGLNTIKVSKITKRGLKIGTANVDTMMRTGRMHELLRTFEKQCLDMVGIQETKVKGSKVITIEGWTLFISGGDENGKKRQGN